MSFAAVFALVLAAVSVSGAPTRDVSHSESGRVGYTVTQIPGVGVAGETLEVDIRVEELFKTPDPSFGKRRLLAGADIVAYLLGPAGALVDARVAAHDGDDGNFVVHFTPKKDGIYSLYVVGTAPESLSLRHAVLVSVGVWPMLPNVVPDPLPKHLPAPSLGDVAHGKLVCARDCVRQPSSLFSEDSEAMRNDELLATIAPGATLRDVDRLDLLAFARSQFIRVHDFFPNALAYSVEKRSLDSDAVARIKILSGEEPATSEGLVFVVYGASQTTPPETLQPIERVMKRQLESAPRLGYVVYGRDGSEIAVAISPKLTVLGARTRDSAGSCRAVRLKDSDAAARRALELANEVVTEERERADIDENLR